MCPPQVLLLEVQILLDPPIGVLGSLDDSVLVQLENVEIGAATMSSCDQDNKTGQHESSTGSRSVVSFVVSKWAILRLLALVYWMAFMSAWNQNVGLIGSRGLQPAIAHCQRVHEEMEFDANRGFWQHPILFWWIPLTDATLDGVATAGVLLASLRLLGIQKIRCRIVTRGGLVASSLVVALLLLL
jgi:hypothetical protein